MDPVHFDRKRIRPQKKQDPVANSILKGQFYEKVGELRMLVYAPTMNR
jgi:hypothetical protein